MELLIGGDVEADSTDEGKMPRMRSRARLLRWRIGFALSEVSNWAPARPQNPRRQICPHEASRAHGPHGATRSTSLTSAIDLIHNSKRLGGELSESKACFAAWTPSLNSRERERNRTSAEDQSRADLVLQGLENDSGGRQGLGSARQPFRSEPLKLRAQRTIALPGTMQVEPRLRARHDWQPSKPQVIGDQAQLGRCQSVTRKRPSAHRSISSAHRWCPPTLVHQNLHSSLLRPPQMAATSELHRIFPDPLPVC